jgi:hypothetical protein
MAGDILENNDCWVTLGDDARHVGPQMPRIIVAAAAPRGAERLAGVAGRDEIHDATPRAAVEGGEVVPDRRESQASLFHARDQDRGGMGFPLHETHGAVAGPEGESDAELESTDPGTKSQAIHRLRRLRLGCSLSRSASVE